MRTIISLHPLLECDEFEAVVHGFRPGEVTIHQTNYAVVFESFEWQITLVIASRQDGKTSWMASLAMCDGDVTVQQGLTETATVHEAINAAMRELTKGWIHPVNQ